MAPTRPLVMQQIEACHNIMGIPQSHTVFMTGAKLSKNRKTLWQDKRIFFLTPQVLVNDLSSGICPPNKIQLLVVDEAHRAIGDHAYCIAVQLLCQQNHLFRILALSATPGTDVKSIQEVITNLMISHIEIRNEDSDDIAQYTHSRKIEKVVIKLEGELQYVMTEFMKILKVYVFQLINKKVLYAKDESTVTKYQILMVREAFRKNPPNSLPKNVMGNIEGIFAICVTLYHAKELLSMHGIRSFYKFIKDSENKPNMYTVKAELKKNKELSNLMSYIEGKFLKLTRNDAENNQVSAEYNLSQIEHSYLASHPKMEKLKHIVLNHFQGAGEKEHSTKVMIFSQYRDSVQEITDMLLKYQPLVRPVSFVGQSSRATKGLAQKEQLKVVKNFKDGCYNTLVATCVAEEGLDIGEVDLIVCYDALKSPIRLVQRLGRTGRKRDGRIFILVTEGKEEKDYNQSQYKRNSLSKNLLNTAKWDQYLYKNCPRMIPSDVNPICLKLVMKIPEFKTEENRKTKSKKKDRSLEGESLLKFIQNTVTEDSRAIEPKNTKLKPSRVKNKTTKVKSTLEKGQKMLLLNEIASQSTKQLPTNFNVSNLKSDANTKAEDFIELSSGEEDFVAENINSFQCGNELDILPNQTDSFADCHLKGGQMYFKDSIFNFTPSKFNNDLVIKDPPGESELFFYDEPVHHFIVSSVIGALSEEPRLRLQILDQNSINRIEEPEAVSDQKMSTDGIPDEPFFDLLDLDLFDDDIDTIEKKTFPDASPEKANLLLSHQNEKKISFRIDQNTVDQQETYINQEAKSNSVIDIDSPPLTPHVSSEEKDFKPITIVSNTESPKFPSKRIGQTPKFTSTPIVHKFNKPILFGNLTPISGKSSDFRSPKICLNEGKSEKRKLDRIEEDNEVLDCSFVSRKKRKVEPTNINFDLAIEDDDDLFFDDVDLDQIEHQQPNNQGILSNIPLEENKTQSLLNITRVIELINDNESKVVPDSKVLKSKNKTFSGIKLTQRMSPVVATDENGMDSPLLDNSLKEKLTTSATTEAKDDNSGWLNCNNLKSSFSSLSQRMLMPKKTSKNVNFKRHKSVPNNATKVIENSLKFIESDPKINSNLYDNSSRKDTTQSSSRKVLNFDDKNCSKKSISLIENKKDETQNTVSNVDLELSDDMFDYVDEIFAMETNEIKFNKQTATRNCDAITTHRLEPECPVITIYEPKSLSISFKKVDIQTHLPDNLKSIENISFAKRLNEKAPNRVKYDQIQSTDCLNNKSLENSSPSIDESNVKLRSEDISSASFESPFVVRKKHHARNILGSEDETLIHKKDETKLDTWRQSTKNSFESWLSDDDFVSVEDNNYGRPNVQNVDAAMTQKRKKKKKRHRVGNELVQLEADVTEKSFSTDESESDLDQFDESFVDDDHMDPTQANVDMRAVYLKSVKSPLAVKKNEKLIRPAHIVYSDSDPSSYECDSELDTFVVNNEEIEYESDYKGDEMLAEDSIMGEALMRNFDDKKRKKIQTKKRKRIQMMDESSSDEGENNKKMKSIPPPKNASEVVDIAEQSQLNETSKNIVNQEEFVIISSDSDQDFLKPFAVKKKKPSVVNIDDDSDFVTAIPKTSPKFESKHKYNKRANVDRNGSQAPVLPSTSSSTHFKVSSIGDKPTIKSNKADASKNNVVSEPNQSSSFQISLLESQSSTKVLQHQSCSSSQLSIQSNISTSSIVNRSTESLTDVCIVVDKSEVATAGVISSNLRHNYGLQTFFHSITPASYILSGRMAVYRISYAVFSNGSNYGSVIKNIRILLKIYQRIIIIVERDKKSAHLSVQRSLHVDKLISQCVQIPQIKLLNTVNHYETSNFLWELIQSESLKKYSIPKFDSNKESLLQKIEFYCKVPQISVSSAISLAVNFRSVREAFNSSTSEINSRCKLSLVEANALMSYATRQFHLDMFLPSRHKKRK